MPSSPLQGWLGALLSCWLLLGFLLVMNAAGYGLAIHDKKQAQRHGSRAQRRRTTGNDRIPERTFIALALFGAGPGALLGFLAVRHKTRKTRFMVPFLLAAAIGVALAAGWIWLLC